MKNLLIAYNGGEASNAALNMAILLANKYDAHLTGILAQGPASIIKNIPTWLPMSVHQTVNEIVGQRTDNISEKFFSYAKNRVTADKLHWINIKQEPTSAVTNYARLFDITILGQYENLIAADELVLHPDRIAYSSGRPILVVPKSYKPSEINEYAIVAWDGRRAAARALFDAIHVLQTKQKVTVITVETSEAVNQAYGLDMEGVLQRYGVNAQYKTISQSKNSIGKTILEYCEQENAGLLVMGAYEHSKISEEFLGGVTSHIFENAKLPVFMSH